MTKIKNLLSAGLLGLTTLFAACSKTGPAGPAGPGYTGGIIGHVTLYDQYGSKITSGLGGIQLALAGPTAATATTDSTGFYSFTNVSEGNYSISVHDPNTANYTFGDTKLQNFQFVRDTLNRDIKLSAVPNFSPATFAAYKSANTANDSLVFTFAPDTRLRDFIIFVNNTSTVNGQPSGYQISYIRPINANATTVTFLVPAADLHNVGINSGATAYYAAYGYPIADNSIYEDYATGKNVYNAISGTPLTANAIAP